MLNNLNSTKTLLPVSSFGKDNNGRFLTLTMLNKNLLEYEPLLEAIYNTLTTHKMYKELSDNKIVFATAVIEGREYSFHPNILLTENSTFESYKNSVIKYITEKYIEGNYGYSNSLVHEIIVKVWDVSHLKNKNIKLVSNNGLRISVDRGNPNKVRQFHTSAVLNVRGNPGLAASIITETNKAKFKNLNDFKLFNANRLRSNITPLNAKQTELKPFATMDIETMQLNKLGDQVPVAISFVSNEVKELILIDYAKLVYLNNGELDINSVDKLVLDMFSKFLDLLKKYNKSSITILVHNLGGFDGLFLFKYLTKILGSEVNTLIDSNNKFIQISYNKIKFIDSYRMFPVKLDALAKLFNVEGKTSTYNSKFNDFSLFKNNTLLNTFKEYSLQDSVCLYQAILSAQMEYFVNYSFDILNALSASSLAFKIFRQNYLNIDIPLLKSNIEKDIRKSYYGGATDYYKVKLTEGKYYDVNSLYPTVMLKDVPITFLGESIIDISELTNFFGFVEVEVYCPSTVVKPMLPVKYKGKTIFPTGSWSGTYFSEEIKAILDLNLGYEFKILKAYEFSRGNIFSEYIKDLYQVKQYSKGSEKFIVKLLLNSLYGIFGRRIEVTKPCIVRGMDLAEILSSKVVSFMTKLHDDLYLLITQSNLRSDTLQELNVTLETTDYSSYQSVIYGHVGIASAITAYARILMMEYKLDPTCAYSDTDSVFLGKDHTVSIPLSDEIGDFKDELDGLLIEEATFLGIKQYGYKYSDKSGKAIEKSVFAGVKRDTLSYDKFEFLLDGGELQVVNNDRFYRSFDNLGVSIKKSTVTVSKSSGKALVGNNYK